MANYTAGLETKKQILEKSKELFYQVGYNELSFKELCKEASVNQGSIVYHFGGKLQIAQQIYAGMMTSMQQQAKELFAGEDEFDVVVLCVLVYFDLFFKDAYFRRFCVQISHENMESVIADQYRSYSPVLYQYLNKFYSANQIEMIIASTTGADVALQQYLYQNIENKSFSSTIDDICKCLFYFVATDVLQPALLKAHKLFNSLLITNSGFDICITRNNTTDC